MITRNKLKKLLTDMESYHIERTASTNNTDKFCQAICAFSNDLSGSEKNGYLIIGVKDNGELSGLKVTDNLLLQISNIRTDGNILPQPIMAVAKYGFEGGDVLMVEVQPSGFPPVRYRGRVWVRVGPRKSIASEAEEKKLAERRLNSAHSFDAMPCRGTTISDLDTSLIKREFLPKAVDEEILVEDNRSIAEQLTSLGYYDLHYDCPTNGAIILFGKTPERYVHGAYVQYVRFRGVNRADDIVNEHKFNGNLCRELVKMDTFIETSISQKRPIPVSVLREETVSKYPYWATRELLMNAIMHRDYDTNSPVLFYEYDDRIEIQNPGGLFGNVSPANFPDVSDYRNPFIAEAMKILGYVNRFSRGVYRVRKELEENGNGAASFDFSLRTTFKVQEYLSVKYLEAGFGIDITQEKAQEKAQEKPKKSPKKSPRKAQEKAQEKPKKSPRKAQEKAQEKPKKSPRKAQEKPGKLREEIMKRIKSNPYVTRQALASSLESTPDSIKYHLRQLTIKGVIKHEGSTKSGKWIIL
ncbi:MAG: putative DNA binding domain-containing protein [Tannerellaceae bacterium]|jgi:ATP-dependent DNA helicase RecG|nr:putative DNA binding domain-containing protein [Tannerellaceae bacterium]